MFKQWLPVFMLVCLPLAAHAAGAIAVDDEVGSETGYGIYTGADSREEAGKEAIKACKEAGNSNCKVVARFDTCGAYVVSDEYYGVGWGSTKGAAIDMAREQCGSECETVVAECE